ncbi:hypothetical protein GTA09_19945, partial [Rhodococcus hoagii]|nr:hypothetical protein [Prescottella equi]
MRSNDAGGSMYRMRRDRSDSYTAAAICAARSDPPWYPSMPELSVFVAEDFRGVGEDGQDGPSVGLDECGERLVVDRALYHSL